MSARRIHLAASSRDPGRGTDTRTRILTAARDLFYEKGYNATGLAEILSRAKANSGSFYHFFESKEALLVSVLDSYLELLEPELLASIYEAVSDPVDRVFALLEKYRDALLATSFSYACPIGRIALEVEPEMEWVHRRVADNFRAWSDAVRDNLVMAGARLPASTDRHRLSVFVLTVMEGAVMQARSQKSIQPFDQSVAALREYFALLEAAALEEQRGRKRKPRVRSRSARRPDRTRDR